MIAMGGDGYADTCRSDWQIRPPFIELQMRVNAWHAGLQPNAIQTFHHPRPLFRQNASHHCGIDRSLMWCDDPIHPHGFGVAVDDVPQAIEAFAPVWLDIAFGDQFLESDIAYVQHPRTIVSVDEHGADRLVELLHVQSTTVQYP